MMSRSRLPRGPEEGGKWAILGGVFDPVHSGHLRLANDFYQTKEYDGILFVPSFDPPHKSQLKHAPFEDRVEMLRLAVGDTTYFVICTIEQEMTEPGFTLNTVRALKKRYPEANFEFIIGADNVHDMKYWFKPEEILEEIQVVAGARPGYEPDSIDEFPGNMVRFVPTSLVDVSSSEIRKQIAEGISQDKLAEMVPPDVARYIMEKEFYR